MHYKPFYLILTMIESFGRHGSLHAGGVKEYQSRTSSLAAVREHPSASHLAGRFLLLSAAIYSLTGTLHSVLTSAAIGKRLRNACAAAWIASAAFKAFVCIMLRTVFGTSIQKPVVFLSNGGISRETLSRITLFLRILLSMCPVLLERRSGTLF